MGYNDNDVQYWYDVQYFSKSNRAQNNTTQISFDIFSDSIFFILVVSSTVKDYFVHLAKLAVLQRFESPFQSSSVQVNTSAGWPEDEASAREIDLSSGKKKYLWMYSYVMFSNKITIRFLQYMIVVSFRAHQFICCGKVFLDSSVTIWYLIWPWVQYIFNCRCTWCIWKKKIGIIWSY